MVEMKMKKVFIGWKNVLFVVIGEREDCCGRCLDEKECCKVIVEQWIMVGMICFDVEWVLGKLDWVSGNNVEVCYQYKVDK